MKKNKVMRFASVVLVMTLLSTCMVGGTFAKYTTSTNGGDSARVAYWGFDQESTTTIDMFDGVYDNGKVDSSNGDNVIAPGTTKTTEFAFGYTPKGQETNALTAGAIAAPEVAYTFTVDAAITGDYDALDANSNFYWTLQAPNAAASSYQTVDELIAAVKALSGNSTGTMTYGAGDLPDAFTDADQIYTIGWAWGFETKDAQGEVDASQDSDDTIMGNAQDLDDVTFTITITATQID